jgi:hypothetical protein
MENIEKCPFLQKIKDCPVIQKCPKKEEFLSKKCPYLHENSLKCTYLKDFIKNCKPESTG